MRNLIIMGLCLAAIISALFLASKDSPENPTAVVENRLKTEEGFSAMPYRLRGVLHIGYGTNLDVGITVREGAFLLAERVGIAEVRLARSWQPYEDMPAAVQVELVDMSYQLGVGGLLEFSQMLDALDRGDYERAAHEAEASRWAAETPKRAARAAAVFRQYE